MRAAPPNLFLKKAHRKWPFSHPKHEENGPKKKLWLDIYVEKGFWAKESAQLVIPVRSTFQNDLHPPIGGPHPVLYFTTQIKKEYCTAMCYLYTTLYDRIGNIGVLRMGKDTKLSFPLAAAFRRLFVTKRPRGAFFAIVRFDERNCPVWGAWNRLRPFARLFLL